MRATPPDDPTFFYQADHLTCDGVPLSEIAASAGTPVYVYSAERLRANFARLERAVGERPHLICYSVKANGNLALGRLLAEMGAGADIVSAGELYRTRLMGIPAERVVFSGVGKRADEIEAAVEAGVRALNVESAGELELIGQVAERLRRRAPIAVRVNPDVDARTHPYISTGMREHKFGVPFEEARSLYDRAAAHPWLEPTGVQMHIGSQLVDPAPIVEAATQLLAFADGLRAAGMPIADLDIGGGLGVRYRDEQPRGPEALMAALGPLLDGKPYTLLLEPGRFLLAETGVLLTRVIYVKAGAGKRFVIVDAGMNDLIRPALYQAHHAIRPVHRAEAPTPDTLPADVVGPVCESSDFLALGRELPDIVPGDLLAVMTAGAYGFSMASSYNARPRPAEVLVDAGAFRTVRRRETLDDLVRHELE